jgi:hypothetical protein
MFRVQCAAGREFTMHVSVNMILLVQIHYMLTQSDLSSQKNNVNDKKNDSMVKEMFKKNILKKNVFQIYTEINKGYQFKDIRLKFIKKLRKKVL